MFLNKADFSELVQKAPLIAIDLCIIKNRSILLGKRLNNPAKNCFFVPGGRVLKNEKIKDTTNRILEEETSFRFKDDIYLVSFLGVFEHFYNDNFLDNEDFNTHYITIAYLIDYKNLVKIDLKKKSEQHSEYIWLNPLKNDNKSINIHKYAMNYLDHEAIKNSTFNKL